MVNTIRDNPYLAFVYGKVIDQELPFIFRNGHDLVGLFQNPLAKWLVQPDEDVPSPGMSMSMVMGGYNKLLRLSILGEVQGQGVVAMPVDYVKADLLQLPRHFK